MSLANSKLSLSSLDFDSLKLSLVSFLQQQTVFQDYNFQGSGLDQLMNLLTYNSYLLSFYMNMVANESFIDSAVLKPNIVSHAKLMGYVPRSATSPVAYVNVAITKANTDPTTILTIPKFTTWSSEPLNGASYSYVTLESYTTSNVNNTFSFANIAIHEGQPVVKSFLVDTQTNPNQIFDLGDNTIDINTLEVYVQTSNTNISQNTFVLATDATQVKGNTNVYYLNMGNNGNYQIYFGDGIIGSSLNDGNIVVASYLNTTGNNSNGLQTFKLQTTLLSGSTSNTTIVQASAGGSAAETGDSIKFNAPKSYLAQNRAVNINDYAALINQKYPLFQSVTVWGGEDNNPPIYGKVFISGLPLNGFAVTKSQQQYLIQQVLQPLGMLTIIPEWKDADINFLNFDVQVYYNPTETNNTPNTLVNIVTSAIDDWANTNLNQFNNTFRKSRLTRAIDDSEQSIDSSSVTVFLEKRINPVPNQINTYTLNYNIPLKLSADSNKLYSSPYFYQNDQTGTARQCYIEEVPQSTTGISAVTINAPGYNFTSVPTIKIQGDGIGANAYAVVTNGQISRVVVDKPGSEYSSAVAIISGGGGAGAILTPVIQSTQGTLRSYYYNSNNVKTTLSANVGTVNYAQGVITLTNFAPINIGNPQGTLSIHIQPLNDNFSSNLNQILAFDQTDAGALTIAVTSD